MLILIEQDVVLFLYRHNLRLCLIFFQKERKYIKERKIFLFKQKECSALFIS